MDLLGSDLPVESSEGIKFAWSDGILLQVEVSYFGLCCVSCFYLDGCFTFSVGFLHSAGSKAGKLGFAG